MLFIKNILKVGKLPNVIVVVVGGQYSYGYKIAKKGNFKNIFNSI